MSGVLESLEAVVVVASAVPLAPDRLATLLEQSPDASLHAAASSGAFLDRVSSLDLSRISLAILPYRAGSGE